MRHFLFYLLPISLLLSLSSCASSYLYEFDLMAGTHDRSIGPVNVSIPEDLHKTRNLSVKNTASGEIIPVQRMASGEISFMLDTPLQAGESRTYALLADKQTSKPPHVHVRQEGEDLTVAVQDKPVLRYHVAEVMPPEGQPAYYRKSGFIHPIYTPAGQVITEGFPEGHMHQHGFFFAWVKTMFEGRTPDFWNQHNQSGRVEHEALVDTVSGPVFGAFSTTLVHTDISGEDGPVRVLDESWTIRVYALDEAFLFDLESVQVCATDSPLHLPEYRYGGMGIRANSEWFEGEGAFKGKEAPNRQGRGQGGFVTSEGLDRMAGNHSRPTWVQMDGTLDGVPSGLVAMGHPSNFRFPQPVRIHPSMPYFCFAPMVAGDFSIEPGIPYVSRYRFLVFTGEPDAELIEEIWQGYAEPMEAVARR